MQNEFDSNLCKFFIILYQRWLLVNRFAALQILFLIASDSSSSIPISQPGTLAALTIFPYFLYFSHSKKNRLGTLPAV
jgi:hypothetical protein